MATLEFTPLEPAAQTTRWIKAPFAYDELRQKRTFAQFTTQRGDSYEGVGEIRVRRNPEGLLAIDLVFTRIDSPYQRTNIIFHLSSRQATQLKQIHDGAEYQFLYEGYLIPDNQLEAAQGGERPKGCGS